MITVVRASLVATVMSISVAASAHPGVGDVYEFWARNERTAGNIYYEYSADFEPRGLGHDYTFDPIVTHYAKKTWQPTWLTFDTFEPHNGVAHFTQLNMLHRLSIRRCDPFRGAPIEICAYVNKEWLIPAVECGDGGVQ